MGNEQRPRENVHATDMSVKQVDGVKRATPHLGVEVEPTPAQPPLLENDRHRQGAALQVHREVVGVPVHPLLAPVDVQAAEQTCAAGHLELVLEGVTGERGMIRLDIEHEVVDEIELA